jgi:hypothetical protein
MKILKKLIKSQDKFGYKFQFKFTKKEEIYKTVEGGLASILMTIIILGLFGWQLSIMASKK